MSKNQLARGIWAGFAPTEDPFAIPNGMEANLRLIDDHIALYTLASPVLSTAALPVPANQGAGQIFRDGSYAVFNAGTWELYPARTGLVAIELSSRTTYINTGALWEVVVPHNWKAYLLKSELLADAAPNGTVGIVTNDPADTDLNHVNGMYVRSGNAWIYSLLQFVERRDLAALAFSGKADDIQETESHKVLSAGERTKIQMLVDEVADARAQFAELTIQLHQQAIALLLGRIQKLESLSQDIQMTAYALAHTANVAASTLVASGSIQRLQVLNRSSDARVGIAFGAPPVSMNDAGLLVLEPGAALDTDLIPSTPIYAIADSEAQLSGAFAVPLNEPNPNWETDFATLMTGMGSDPGGVWTTAYRRLYSALRRDGILARSRGLYVFAAHSDQAARQNWAAPGSYAVAIGAPVFTAKTGFVYNG
ncbi:hypothetical protein, partial [Comamonas aquatilis]|uniref:hypothetical protein n=1 Tax=Comamonas aquatilis TaxID=1778406 RepID=UPI0039EE62C6